MESNAKTLARCRSRLGALLAALVLLAAALPAGPARAAAPAPRAAQTADELCAKVRNVPTSECAALVALYNATGGANWLNAAGWLSSAGAAPCDWYGVTCTGGHVVKLRLARNRLTGALPAGLSWLPNLVHLDVGGNGLTSTRFANACAPGRSLVADLSYNALAILRADVRACLERLDPGWSSTQTVPPLDPRPQSFEATAITIGWTPISYAGSRSYYEISYATSRGGPYTVHGRTSGTAASSYRLDGLARGKTYYVQVQTVTQAHASNPTEVRSLVRQTVAVTRGSGRTLLMVFFPADNDLSHNVPAIIERMRVGTQFNPNVQVVLLADQRGPKDTTFYTIAGGVTQATNIVYTAWGRHELNTADPAVLSWFLRYARRTYPAAREMVALMGHGIPLAPEIAWPDTSRPPSPGAPPPLTNRIPALPVGIDATPGDVTDRSSMSTAGLGRALLAATQDGGPFDIVFFDQCFQGNLDMLYEVREAADIFIASPNYAWLAAPYDEYIPLLAPAQDVSLIADAMLERYQLNLNEWHPNVIFAIKSADIELVADAVNQLGDALGRATRGGQRQPIINAIRYGQYVDTTQCGRQNLTLGPPDELVGLGSLAYHLSNNFPAGDPYGVHQAAVDIEAVLNPLNKRVRVGNPYLAPGELWDYSGTITVLAPLPADSLASIAWRSSLYTETVPLSATWSAMPTMTVQISSSLAFVREGSWDEFLAGWYGAPLAPTVGEWCHYIPPPLVEGADVEPLSLTASAVSHTGAQLGWGAAASDGVSNYWVYRKSDQEISWASYAVLPVGQTTLPVHDLQPGKQYHYIVVAQTDAGDVLAKSNELLVETLPAN